ncbi:MAG TPA: rod shape-determining protein RodA [Thermoanaerobaculia bacterium]|nr:rod shape-determining protein RodA [Thermoanaerobaculia bacterium]
MRGLFQRRRVDTTLLLAVLALLGIGLLLVASSTLGGRNAELTGRQAMWMGVGIALMLGMLAVDYRVLLKFSFPIYAASLAPLVYLLALGHRIAHVRSWVRFGGYQFQPAEVAKVATALLLAYLFENEQDRRLRPAALGKLFAMVLVPCLLVFLQPDLGLALTFVPLLLVGMYFGRMRRRYWALLAAALVVCCAVGWLFLKDYQKQRITTFVHPDVDVSGAGYQVRQSKIAVGSGGLVGKGYRRGTQSQLRFLPVRHTDFIFAVLAEEFGFLGVLVVLSLYATVVLRGLRLATHARDRGGAFLVLGLTACLFFSVMLNTGMMIGLFPTTGIPLPLLSYGGSSVATTLASIGLILSVEARRFANA